MTTGAAICVAVGSGVGVGVGLGVGVGVGSGVGAIVAVGTGVDRLEVGSGVSVTTGGAVSSASLRNGRSQSGVLACSVFCEIGAGVYTCLEAD